MIDVKDLIGVPFREFGRDAKTGLDCYGLVIEVAKRYGKTLRDVAVHNYSVEEASKAADMYINVVRTKDWHKPCIVLEFRGIDGRLHVGITIDEQGTFLHATENQGVRVSTMNSAGGYLKLVHAYEIIDRGEA